MVKMPQEISENPIPYLLKDILKFHRSGELSVQLGKIRKSLFFSEGMLVYARSSAFNEQLGVILHLLGKINEEQYDYISGLAHSPDEDVGEILIRDHFVSEEDLRDVFLYQLKKIAVSVFLAERGTYEFKEGPAPKLKKQKLSVSTAEVIIEGGRKLRHVTFFKKKFYSSAPGGGEIPDIYDPLLSTDEKLLFKNLEGCEELSNFEIISKLNVDPAFYWRTMVIFWLLEMVTFTSREVQYNMGEEIQELLQLKIRTDSIRKDPYELLGLSRDCSREEAESRYLAMIHRYHPDRFGSAAAPEIKKTAEVVAKSIEKAYRSLSFHEEAAESETAEPAGIDMGDGFEDMSDVMTFDPIEIEVDYQVVDVNAAAAEDEEETDESSELDVKEKSGAEHQDDAERETVEMSADPEDSQEISDIREQTGTGNFHDPREEAKVFYLKARDLYNSKKYMEAVNILKQTVSIDPTIADYFFLLGKCQVELEFFDVDAERNFKKAIEIDSFNADYIYNLALLFKKGEKKNLAVKCFQRVLEVNPRYVKAEIAINELKGKKVKKSSIGFKKKK